MRAGPPIAINQTHSQESFPLALFEGSNCPLRGDCGGSPSEDGFCMLLFSGWRQRQRWNSSGKMLGGTSLPERKKDEVVNSNLGCKIDKNSNEAETTIPLLPKDLCPLLPAPISTIPPTTPIPYMQLKTILLHVLGPPPSSLQ